MKVTISADFDLFELAALISFIRGMDKHQPDRQYLIAIDDTDATIEEAEAKLRALVPTAPDRKTNFIVIRKE